MFLILLTSKLKTDLRISSLITDLYSRKIVGLKFHDSLEFEEYINALNRTFAQILQDYPSFDLLFEELHRYSTQHRPQNQQRDRRKALL